MVHRECPNAKSKRRKVSCMPLIRQSKLHYTHPCREQTEEEEEVETSGCRSPFHQSTCMSTLQTDGPPTIVQHQMSVPQEDPQRETSENRQVWEQDRPCYPNEHARSSQVPYTTWPAVCTADRGRCSACERNPDRSDPLDARVFVASIGEWSSVTADEPYSRRHVPTFFHSSPAQ